MARTSSGGNLGTSSMQPGVALPRPPEPSQRARGRLTLTSTSMVSSVSCHKVPADAHPAVNLSSPVDVEASSNDVCRREVTFVAADGFALGGTLFEGAGGGPLVLISSATGVPRGYYAAFASALCNAGARAALTYDYRGLPGCQSRRAGASGSA